MAKWPYNTAQWQRLRRAKLSTDPLCQYCPADTLTPATEVDHAKAISDGGDPFAWENLRSSCKPCHSRKTMTMDGGGGNRKRESMPVKGCDASGVPLDRSHHWNST